MLLDHVASALIDFLLSLLLRRRSSSLTKNSFATYTTAWRPAPTPKPRASLTISSVLSVALWPRWKQRDKKAQSPKSTDFTMSKRERTRCRSTRRFRTCFRLIESMMTRRSRWGILSWSIKFRSLQPRPSLKFSTTSSCGRSFVASCRSCRTKSDHRSKTSNGSSTAINTTTCHGTSARNWRTTGWDLGLKLWDRIRSWSW